MRNADDETVLLLALFRNYHNPIWICDLVIGEMSKKKQIVEVKIDFEQLRKNCIQHVQEGNRCFLLEPGAILTGRATSLYCNPSNCPMVEK